MLLRNRYLPSRGLARSRQLAKTDTKSSRRGSSPLLHISQEESAGLGDLKTVLVDIKRSDS